MLTRTPIIKCAPEDRETLHHLTNLLHLFHHRNKNQHRRSIWWRAFSTFRKQLQHLDNEITHLNAEPTTHLERSRKKAKDKALRARISQRLKFWEDVAVVKWRAAFSQIVADARFAALGLVLLAVLAQVCQVVGCTAALEEMAQREVERVLEEFGREMRAEEREEGGRGAERTDDGLGEGEDVGEVIGREALIKDGKGVGEGVDLGSGVDDVEARKSKRQKPSQPEKKVRKKRKTGNAIDDLFSGLD